MAVEVALEDDLFFADLNRQISLLIDDDDDDDFPVARFPSVSPQGYSTMIHHQAPIMPTHYLYQENCRREVMSKGTGVFIPQSSQPRRKHKQPKRSTPSAKSNGNNNNNNKQLVGSNRRAAKAVAHTNNLSTANYINRY